MFENAGIPFTPRPIMCMRLDQSWKSSPNLKIIGDAAHGMSPFAGEGANMAMLDALGLSECLDSEKYLTTGKTIAAFETAMRSRAAVAAKLLLIMEKRCTTRMRLR